MGHGVAVFVLQQYGQAYFADEVSGAGSYVLIVAAVEKVVPLTVQNRAAARPGRRALSGLAESAATYRKG